MDRREKRIDRPNVDPKLPGLKKGKERRTQEKKVWLAEGGKG